MNNCIFDKIIRGEIPAAKVWEDENYLAFMDVRPHTPGHTLVIPKKHIEYIFDMDDHELTGLILACKPISHAIKKAFNPNTGFIGMVVAGTAVPHVHIHLIPMNSEGDLDMGKGRDTSFEELEKNAKKIREAII